MIKRSQWSEFAAMGFITGIIAVAGTELIKGFSYYFIFHLNYQPAVWAWVLLPFLTALVIGIFGLYSSRQILTKSPILVLREL